MKHDDTVTELHAQAHNLGFGLSVHQAASLVAFEALLLRHGVPQGLVAKGDASRLRERHILDCLRGAAAVRASDRWAYDLGSGAGLPGIVVAIARPRLRVSLVDARRRRAAFLELAVEELRLPNAEVLTSRIEDLRGTVDLCFARALAPLEEAWRLASPLLAPAGRLVYFAGGAAEYSAPPGAKIQEVRMSTVLESAGPLVIMAR